MRLIDADALIEFWKADFTEEERIKLRIPLNVAIENLRDSPIVDAVSVVRCKDCVHKDALCPLYGGSQFFCAYGEREEE